MWVFFLICVDFFDLFGEEVVYVGEFFFGDVVCEFGVDLVGEVGVFG